MLAHPAPDPEGFRRIRVLRALPFILYLRFQGINQKTAAHQIDEAAPKIVGQVLIFHFRIQADDIQPGFPQIAQDQL